MYHDFKQHIMPYLNFLVKYWGDEGLLAFIWMVASYRRKEIIEQLGAFPVLQVYGPSPCGKTSLAAYLIKDTERSRGIADLLKTDQIETAPLPVYCIDDLYGNSAAHWQGQMDYYNGSKIYENHPTITVLPSIVCITDSPFTFEPLASECILLDMGKVKSSPDFKKDLEAINKPLALACVEAIAYQMDIKEIMLNVKDGSKIKENYILMRSVALKFFEMINSSLLLVRFIAVTVRCETKQQKVVWEIMERLALPRKA